ncbi:2-dehydropantoate 2-reductase [Parachitinimonas caeni]|uniref:2-dehydropantoate 2-reductase n=1 Tax=Parachitinimonas caeni TaxID=3031301 RepID=A0ABT7E4X4_9NEIS|nr:2-dehydropantoate 2-reductase [Parachitinimonas caeni]MDK2125967.1 2-dehydropantoate 2-reductase [Parachitinimonas caeni]
MLKPNPRIVIAGAGSVGCYVGGCLRLANRPVTLLVRPRMADIIQRHGLRLTDFEGRDRRIAAGDMALATDPGCLATADLILVTVKSSGTATIASTIARNAARGAVIVSLQNGVGNTDVLRSLIFQQTAYGGMVPFNVVQLEGGRFHRGTGGSLLVDAACEGLAQALQVEGLPVASHADMSAVMWGKLLINLNNALNALSGVPLVQELSHPAWRRLLAASMREALDLLKAAGIQPATIEKVPPWAIPYILRLPTPLFRLVAGRMLKIDPEARSSMWEDLQQGRLTEIDYLQGAVIALARTLNRPAPIATRIVAAIRKAEAEAHGSPSLLPRQLLEG